MRVWFKRAYVHYHAPLPTDAPIIFASTHPNSAVDYLFSPIIHHMPTYVLVRGDVFEKKVLNTLFRAIFMLPVYRFRDGYASLNKNEQSFKECYKTFDKNGKVLIFSEGVCVQEKVLQPLRKGTARLALDYLHKHGGKKIYVVTQATNYTNFRKFRSAAMVNFGEAIDATQYYNLYKENPNKAYEALTQEITHRLQNDFIAEENYRDDSVTEKALMALRLDYTVLGSNWSQITRSRFELENNLVKKLNALGENALSEEWKTSATELHLKPENEGLLSANQSRLEFLFKIIVLAPFVGLGWLTVAIPNSITNWLIKNKIKDKIFQTTVTLIGGVLLYMIQAIVLLIVGISAFGLYGLALPILMLIFTALSVEVIDEFRLAYFNRSNTSKRDAFQALHREVKALLETP